MELDDRRRWSRRMSAEDATNVERFIGTIEYSDYFQQDQGGIMAMQPWRAWRDRGSGQ